MAQITNQSDPWVANTASHRQSEFPAEPPNLSQPTLLRRIMTILMVSLLLGVIGLGSPQAQAQIDRPWEHPNGPACFELWISTALSRLNSYIGDDDFNIRKPYRMSPWGLIEDRYTEHVSPADNWGQFGGDKYWWMWGNYIRETRWPNPDYNTAGVPMMRPFVLACIEQAGGGGFEPPPPELLDTWYFGRVGGASLGKIKLTSNRGSYGYLMETNNPNETYWRVERGELLFLNRQGTVTSRLRPENANRWTGSFVPDPRITHYIDRVGAGRGWEAGINRRGGDYRSFWMEPEPELCRNACNREAQCLAWTYVRPGIQGERAQCWLKSTVPAPSGDDCCVSGIKGGR